VYYESGPRPGYRLRADLVLSASERGNPGDPTSVQLGDDRRPARVLAKRVGFDARVLLLAVAPSSDLSGRSGGDWLDDVPLPQGDEEALLDFKLGIAHWPGGSTSGHFIVRDGSIDFVTQDGGAPPAGAAIFLDSRLVGLAARRRLLPEHWALTIAKMLGLLVAEGRPKIVNGAIDENLKAQLVSLWTSLRSNWTCLWSLRELVNDPDFAPHLRPQGAGTETKDRTTATPQDFPMPAATGHGPAHTWDNQANQADVEMIIIGKAPRDMWGALERPPRPFPIGPRARDTRALALVLIIAIVLYTLAGAISALVGSRSKGPAKAAEIYPPAVVNVSQFPQVTTNLSGGLLRRRTRCCR
jgi:hypothetical protein